MGPPSLAVSGSTTPSAIAFKKQGIPTVVAIDLNQRRDGCAGAVIAFVELSDLDEGSNAQADANRTFTISLPYS